MKKILAVVMAIVMMMAIAVPAFAATTGSIVDKAGAADTTTVIKTSTDKADGTDGAYYVVTIPADTTIAWGTPVKTLTYSVESHLKYGERLSVSVAGNNAMTYEPAPNTVLSLAYELGGVTAFNADKEVINPAVDKDITVTVTDDAWANAIVGEYADTLTFTASVA